MTTPLCSTLFNPENKQIPNFGIFKLFLSNIKKKKKMKVDLKGSEGCTPLIKLSSFAIEKHY
jgi:hypothetical protein